MLVEVGNVPGEEAKVESPSPAEEATLIIVLGKVSQETKGGPSSTKAEQGVYPYW